MKHRQKLLSVCLLAMGGVLSMAPIQGAWAQTAPDLGTASNFAVLSAAPGATGAVACTGGAITGDVGSSGGMPSVVLTEGCTITGSTVAPVSAQVLADFDTAYDGLAAVSCGEILTGSLAGVTLAPGVYCFDGAAALTGVLTLAGPSDGTWIFKIGTPLAAPATGALTGTGFSMVLDGPSARNVTWWVAEGATMTDSAFQGTILAGAGITITRGTFDGRALAEAAVTTTDAVVSGTTPGCTTTKKACEESLKQDKEDFDANQKAEKDAFYAGHPDKVTKKAFDDEQKADKKAFDEQWKAAKEQCKTLEK